MPAKRKSFRVVSGNNHITIAPWTHPSTGKAGWRLAYRPSASAPWKYKHAASKEDATKEAESLLAKQGPALSDLPPARVRWLQDVSNLTPSGHEQRVIDYIKAMSSSADIAASVQRFLASKTSKAGEETPHMGTMRNLLESFAHGFFGMQVCDIQLDGLQAWYDERCSGLGWKRKKDIRASLVQFYRWARREGISGAGNITVAERLPEIGGEHGERRILTVDEFQSLRDAIGEEWRAWLVLGCFAGLRPEEIAPDLGKKRKAKRGLLCEEIDWRFKVIRLPACVSKVNLPRIVPLSDAALDGLAWAGIEPGMTGPVCLQNPSQAKELARLGKIAFGGNWPKDICRHSYGSYRNAVIRDMGKLAEEMGTSVSMLHRHYHNPQPTESGEAWFALRPSGKVEKKRKRVS